MPDLEILVHSSLKRKEKRGLTHFLSISQYKGIKSPPKFFREPFAASL